MIIAILQARVSSTRLPGKVLKPILGKPMLQHQVERILKSKKIDKLVIATSNDSSDEAIYKLCKTIKIDCYRGSLDNVLDRFYWTAKRYNPTSIVRLTGDCPLIDPFFIDELINFYMDENCDYASNCLEPTLPDGLDAEIFTFKALEKAWKEAELPSEREHVTPYINSNPDIFRVRSWKYKIDLSHMRWTVDEKEDFELVKKIYEQLYNTIPDFNTDDILNLLKKYQDLTQINSMYIRNEGFLKSIELDKIQHDKI